MATAVARSASRKVRLRLSVQEGLLGSVCCEPHSQLVSQIFILKSSVRNYSEMKSVLRVNDQGIKFGFLEHPDPLSQKVITSGLIQIKIFPDREDVMVLQV